jgi:hypothetical protein
MLDHTNYTCNCLFCKRKKEAKILKSLRDGLEADLKRGEVECGMSRAIGALFIAALSQEQSTKEQSNV